MEDDYVVRMPPVREYKIRMRVGKVEKASPPNLVIEDEVMDAMEISGWDNLSDEAWEEFEKLVEESEPGTFLERLYWTISDWKDWLMGR